MAFVVSEQSGGKASDLGHSGLTPIASNSGDAGWVQDNWTQQWFPRLYTTGAFDDGGDAARLQRMNQIKTLFNQYQSGQMDRQGYQSAVQQFPWVNRLVWITGNWFNPTSPPPTGGGGGGGGTTPPPTGGGGTTPPVTPPPVVDPRGRGWEQGKADWKMDQLNLPPGLAARLPQLPSGGTSFSNERPEGFGPQQPQSWIERLLKNQQDGNSGQNLGKSQWE